MSAVYYFYFQNYLERYSVKCCENLSCQINFWHPLHTQQWLCPSFKTTINPFNSRQFGSYKRKWVEEANDSFMRFDERNCNVSFWKTQKINSTQKIYNFTPTDPPPSPIILHAVVFERSESKSPPMMENVPTEFFVENERVWMKNQRCVKMPERENNHNHSVCNKVIINWVNVLLYRMAIKVFPVVK